MPGLSGADRPRRSRSASRRARRRSSLRRATPPRHSSSALEHVFGGPFQGLKHQISNRNESHLMETATKFPVRWIHRLNGVRRRARRCSYARAVQVHWTTNRVFCSSRRKSLRAKRRRRCPQIKDKRWYCYLVTWPIMRQASRNQQSCVPQQHATEFLQTHPSTQLPADYLG